MNLTSPLNRTRACVLGWLAVYFFLQFATRAMLGGSLQTDEAEQVLLAQQWRWGYGSQGPLYTWLQRGLFLLSGPGVGALAFLKNLLLFSVYLFTCLSAREVLRRENQALLATAALLLLPHLAWESQRDQTHLVLASALSAATTFVVLRLVRAPSLAWHLLLGLAAGAGLLAKLNFIFFLLGLILAVLSLPEGRAVLLTRGGLLALALLAVVVAPYAAWAARNPELLMSQSHKLGLETVVQTAPRWLLGLENFFTSLAEYLLLPALFALLLWRAPRADEADAADHGLARLLLRAQVLALALSLVAVVGFGAAQVKSRWLQPLLLSLPILVVYAARARLTPARQRPLFWLAVAVSAVVLGAVNGTVLGAKWLGRPHNVNVAFDDLARQLRQAGFSRGNLISNSPRIAGNLLQQFPDCRALAPTMEYFVGPLQAPTLLVWDATSKADPPQTLVATVLRLWGQWPTGQEPRFIEAPGHHGDPQICRLGFVLLPEGVPLSPQAPAGN